MPVVPRRLELGAFDRVHDGWLSTDITPHLLVARVPGLPWLLHRAGVIGDERYVTHRSGAFRQIRYLDLNGRLRFPDDYFECVYSSHVLEHLHPDVAERCLREVRRILAPGGIVRVAVPNLDGLVARYDPADPDTFLYGLYQGRGSASVGSSERHWWHYNAGSLESLLRRTGFTEIRTCAYREGDMPDVGLVDNREGSLFMEAVK
jgi:SAM-dependent methyltransferase